MSSQVIEGQLTFSQIAEYGTIMHQNDEKKESPTNVWFISIEHSPYDYDDYSVNNHINIRYAFKTKNEAVYYYVTHKEEFGNYLYVWLHQSNNYRVYFNPKQYHYVLCQNDELINKKVEHYEMVRRCALERIQKDENN